MLSSSRSQRERQYAYYFYKYMKLKGVRNPDDLIRESVPTK
jgi:hypothetical protein